MTTQSDTSGGAAAFAQFTAELEELRTKAEQVQNRIRSASATARSADGAVTVTVGPGGVVQNLTLDSRAYRRPPEALSALILQLIGVAGRQVSTQVAAALSTLVGEDSQAMRLLEEFAPQEPDADQRAEPAPPRPPPPAPPRQPAQQQSSRRTQARPPVAEDDDADFEDPW